jgi:NAD(P)-dependent dehydrogenase (short-subunit alcohol dehydrogenase family)
VVRRRVEDSVVVVMGASSGIGRATAHFFARRGAAVVLAARREEALIEVSAECESLGGQALFVRTDVTSRESVVELARRAVEHCGRIDLWVNNASVTSENFTMASWPRCCSVSTTTLRGSCPTPSRSPS